MKIQIEPIGIYVDHIQDNLKLLQRHDHDAILHLKHRSHPANPWNINVYSVIENRRYYFGYLPEKYSFQIANILDNKRLIFCMHTYDNENNQQPYVHQNGNYLKLKFDIIM